MSRYILRQILFIVISFIGILLVSYSLLVVTAAPGSPLNDLSLMDYIQKVFAADLGVSSVTSQDVMTSFLTHLPASVELVVLASLLATIVGIPLGIIAARRHRTATDTLINTISIAAYSMPVFWWAILLIVFFAIDLNWAPVAGRLSFIYDIEPVTGFMLIDTYLSEQPYRLEAFQDAISHLALPTITLATLPAAIISRMTRQTMLNTLNEDYIKTAQVKGLSDFRIFWVHGLRNAIIPLTNMLSLQISTLMTGAMVTEYIFAWPGIGKWLLDAVAKADYQALAAGFLLTASMVILINAAIELVGLWLNPRLRAQQRVYHG